MATTKMMMMIIIIIIIVILSEYNTQIGHIKLMVNITYNNQMSVYAHTCIMKWHICYRSHSVHVWIQGCILCNSLY